MKRWLFITILILLIFSIMLTSTLADIINTINFDMSNNFWYECREMKGFDKQPSSPFFNNISASEVVISCTYCNLSAAVEIDDDKIAPSGFMECRDMWEEIGELSFTLIQERSYYEKEQIDYDWVFFKDKNQSYYQGTLQQSFEILDKDPNFIEFSIVMQGFLFGENGDKLETNIFSSFKLYNNESFKFFTGDLKGYKTENQQKIIQNERKLSTLESFIETIKSWLFFSKYQNGNVCNMVKDECGLNVNPPPQQGNVIFRTNVNNDDFIKCSKNSNCWIVLDLNKDGALEPYGYNGKFVGCEEGTTLFNTANKGYSVVDYGDSKKVEICQNDVGIKFDSRTQVNSPVLSKLPTEPYASNNQEVYD